MKFGANVCVHQWDWWYIFVYHVYIFLRPPSSSLCGVINCIKYPLCACVFLWAENECCVHYPPRPPRALFHIKVCEQVRACTWMWGMHHPELLLTRIILPVMHKHEAAQSKGKKKTGRERSDACGGIRTEYIWPLSNSSFGISANFLLNMTFFLFFLFFSASVRVRT